MERKILNSQLSRRTHEHFDKTLTELKRTTKRTSTVSQVIRQSKCGDKRDCRFLANQTTRQAMQTIKREVDSEVTESGENSNNLSVHSDYGLKSNKIKHSFSSSSSTPRSVDGKVPTDVFEADLRRCKKDLADTNNATKELQQKYEEIKDELKEIHQRHDRFIAERSSENGNKCGGGTDSEYSIKCNCKQLCQHGNSLVFLSDGRNELKRANATASSQKGLSQTQIMKKISSTPYSNSRQVSNDKCHNPQGKWNSKSNGCLNSKIKTRSSKDTVSLFETLKGTSLDQLPMKRVPQTSNLSRIYEKIHEVRSTESKGQELQLLRGLVSNDIRDLQRTISELQKEQAHLFNVIQQQKINMKDFNCRYIKAKCVMETQRYEIEKLMRLSKDFQTEAEKENKKLRHHLEDKINEMVQLSQKLYDVKTRYERVMKENHGLNERVHTLQTQNKDLKQKLEDLTKQKTTLTGRLKNAERDLRVFKNYNTALKDEKVRQTEEIQKIREQLNNQETASKRFLSRQRELGDRNCRDLQRRIYELEHKLGCSKDSTSGLLKQRDRVISELQSQVNALVHNFEMSQKHIRVLRGQIVNAAGLTNKSTRKNM